MKRTLLFASLLVVSMAAARTVTIKMPTADEPPATPKRPVTDRVGTLSITDDYRWLEDGHDPEVHTWATAQTERAEKFLRALPGRDALAQRLTTIAKHRSTAYRELISAGGQIFALKREPPKQQSMIVVRKSLDGGDERVLVDPNALDGSGALAVDWFVVSRDGKRMAVSLSRNGSERGDLHFYDVASGKALSDVIEHVQNGTAGGSASFDSDGNGVFYTRYPHPGERAAADLDLYQQVYFHKLGTPVASDTYQVGKELPRIAEIKLDASSDGHWTLATVENGDGSEYEFFLRGNDGRWQRLAGYSDRVMSAAFGRGDDHSLYLVSLKDLPLGRVLRLPLATPTLEHAKPIVSATDAAIERVNVTDTRVWVTEMAGGPSRLRDFALDGSDEKTVALPPVSQVGEGVALDGDTLGFDVESYVQPQAWYRVTPTTAPEATALRTTAAVDFSGIEVVRATATSKDGTKVPYTVLHKKGAQRSGNNPTLLYGYGGFGIAMAPRFKPDLAPWLDAGGVYVVANIRGGGEYGDAWHRGGTLTHKQNVFDDFIAVAEALVKDKWTTPARFAIEGGSNGGLLMGATLTQQPELFRAVLSHVGIYDMLRSELTTNGQFNVSEYGSTRDPAQLAALYAYSPYHHVSAGTKYPAVLFTTGDNDPRVDPMHSRKMVARLQAATESDQPILLRTSAKAGHGMGSSLDEKIALDVDSWSFVFAELGVTPPK